MPVRSRPLLFLLLFACAACVATPIHARTRKKPVPAPSPELPYRWVEIDAGGAKLRGIFADSGGPPVLVLYGSGMGIAGVWELVQCLHEGGYGVLCCDYRGTGWSSGRWGTSRHLDDDARALWEWLVREKGPRAGVVGVSIGAVAAAPLASHETPPAAVVLDRPVDPRTVAGRFVAKELGGFGRNATDLITRASADVDMRAALARARAPTLLLLPEFDALCPPIDVGWMVGEASASVRRRVVPGGHLSSHLVEPETWRAAVLDFLDAQLRPGQPPLGGRDVPDDPHRVADASLVDGVLRVRLEPPPEGRVRLLVMGRGRSAFVEVEEARAEMTIPLPRKAAREIGALFGVRSVPLSFRRAIGARWVVGSPP